MTTEKYNNIIVLSALTLSALTTLLLCWVIWKQKPVIVDIKIDRITTTDKAGIAVEMKE